MEKLLAETGAYRVSAVRYRQRAHLWIPARHFDRDPETNEVLWFAAPPLSVARTPAPRYSLQYLHWLAAKRKGVDDEDMMDVDGEEQGRGKRARGSVKATATETVEKLLAEMGGID
jgi:chromatin structure-remodeling complex subunit RSC1/2